MTLKINPSQTKLSGNDQLVTVFQLILQQIFQLILELISINILIDI